jgi:hypothetical protein
LADTACPTDARAACGPARRAQQDRVTRRDLTIAARNAARNAADPAGADRDHQDAVQIVGRPAS